MKRFLLVCAALAALALGTTACKKPAPQPAPEIHSSTGVIREIKNDGRILVVEHQDFPGFMKAMTMPFELKDPALAAGLKVGDKVAFSITATDNGFPVTAIKKLDQ